MLFALVPALALLLLTEAVLRLGPFRLEVATLQVEHAGAHTVRMFESHLSSEHFVADPVTFWKPRPEKPPFNSLGYRGAELPRERADGELRVLAVGDSNTVGHSASWVNEMPDGARDELGGRTLRVVNAGVYGYTSYQGKHHLGRFLAYQPDVVLISFGGNDATLNNVADKDYDPYVPHPVYAFFGRRVAVVNLLEYLSVRWKLAGDDRPQPPQRLVSRVSLADYEANLVEMVELARSIGAVPVLVTGRSWILALTGWLRYGDASTNIAASQGAAPVAPRLEVETAAGTFEPLDVVVGMPAGKTKTILVDLAGKLGDGTRRLRLTTSFEIRWDRIAVGERLAAQGVSSHVAFPVSAELYERGFSEIRSRAPGHPATPEFAAVATTPPWQGALQGWMTRYGDVLELVTQRDERLALVGAGDAVELTFDAADFPPLAPGRLRTFFFYSVGWDKDGDLNVIDGETVEPLPVAASGDWQGRFNTRWVPRDAFRD